MSHGDNRQFAPAFDGSLTNNVDVRNHSLPPALPDVSVFVRGLSMSSLVIGDDSEPGAVENRRDTGVTEMMFALNRSSAAVSNEDEHAELTMPCTRTIIPRGLTPEASQAVPINFSPSEVGIETSVILRGLM